MNGPDLTIFSDADPRLSAAGAGALAAQLFGIGGRARRLYGEKDQNFRLETPDGEVFLLKVSHSGESPPVTDLQTKLLQHVAAADPDLPLPRLVPSRQGEVQPAWQAPDGSIRQVRLMTFLSGGALDRRAATPPVLFVAGAALARLDLALSDFRHSAEDQSLIWDLQQTASLRSLAPHLENAGWRAVAEAALDRFDQTVAPRLPHLRRQMIHNDLNPGNVLVEAAPAPRVTGIIDFGDALRASLAQEVAVCAAYHVRPGRDPLILCRSVVAGFHSVIPLRPEELDLLPDLILARQTMGLLIHAWRGSLKPAPSIAHRLLVDRLGRRVQRLLSPSAPIAPSSPETRP